MNHNEIQKGDTVKVTATLTVDSIIRNGLGQTKLNFTHPKRGAGHVILDDDDKVKLIERPFPPLPTEIGSVILVDGQRWFCRQSTDPRGHRWHPAKLEGALSASEMLSLAKKAGGFEVLL